MSRFFNSNSLSSNQELPANLSLPTMSLMYPEPLDLLTPPTVTWEHDLGMEDLVHALTSERRYRSYIRTILLHLITDETILRWRHAVSCGLYGEPDDDGGDCDTAANDFEFTSGSRDAGTAQAQFTAGNVRSTWVNLTCTRRF